MFFALKNDNCKTTTDAKKTAPCSRVAKNEEIIDIIIAGIVMALPAISILNINLAIIMGIAGLLLGKIIIMCITHFFSEGKVKRKLLVLN